MSCPILKVEKEEFATRAISVGDSRQASVLVTQQFALNDNDKKNRHSDQNTRIDVSFLFQSEADSPYYFDYRLANI